MNNLEIEFDFTKKIENKKKYTKFDKFLISISILFALTLFGSIRDFDSFNNEIKNRENFHHLIGLSEKNNLNIDNEIDFVNFLKKLSPQNYLDNRVIIISLLYINNNKVSYYNDDEKMVNFYLSENSLKEINQIKDNLTSTDNIINSINPLTKTLNFIVSTKAYDSQANLLKILKNPKLLNEYQEIIKEPNKNIRKILMKDFLEKAYKDMNLED